MAFIAQTVDDMFKIMVEKLGKIVPEVELRYKAELAVEVNRLKQEKNAVILGHNYMEPALYYSVPDYTGDSLGLAREAARTDKDIIVFCGVRFMAETAKILNPEKTVLLPTPKGGCSLAESITAADVRELRKQYPGVPVVTYVNTYADVKAESDVCCTSGNARQVVESFTDHTIIFLPDEFMAKNIAKETGKQIILPTKNPAKLKNSGDGVEYRMIGWSGKCEVHEQFTVEDGINVRRQFPDVVVLAHLECKPEVIAVSDYSGSTTGMIKYVETTQAPRYLLLTECSMGDNIAAANPHKEMLRLCSIRCPHMNEITLEQTRDSLLSNRYVIDVPEDIRLRAKQAVDRMIAIG